MSAPHDGADPTRELPQPPSVRTAPPGGGPRRWWSRVPHHLGRARTSTVVLTLLFLAIGTLYLYVRPEGTAGGSAVPVDSTVPVTGTAEPTEPVQTTEPAPTTEPATPTPSRSTSPGPTTARTPAQGPTDQPTTSAGTPAGEPTASPPTTPRPTAPAPATPQVPDAPGDEPAP